jgi:predicted phage terminase large subunit-like protein
MSLLYAAESSRATASSESLPGYTQWLPKVLPEFRHDWDHLKYVRKQLADVTRSTVDRLAIAWPPQHGKTRNVTVPYPLWRMLKEPGLRAGVGAHTQRYADKISRWVKKLAMRSGCGFGDVSRVDEWELANGSTFISRGAGASIAGEPLDLFLIDDPFGSREDADSPTIQESIYEWYMDDVTPRIQKGGAVIVIHARWGPGDLIGRILDSEEGHEWRYVKLPAIAEENDPIGRQPGQALCEDRFPLGKLEQKRRIEGVGFESLYQQNPIPRGGQFFQRVWFGSPVDAVPESAKIKRIRYWDLAASRKDSACFTAGVLLAKTGDKGQERFYVEDVVRGRWVPGERNDVMLQTAQSDKARPGFQRTYFEAPVFDTGKESTKAILARMSGHPVRADNVSGSKELRAEPLSDAARGGLVKLVTGSWNGAFLTELEGFPKGSYKDQVDSAGGAYNVINRGDGMVVKFFD